MNPTRMSNLPTKVSHILLVLLSLTLLSRAQDLPGTWEILLPNAGISSMHTAVTHLNSVILLDRTNIGPSNLTFPLNNPHHLHPCHVDPTLDCTAHSALFHPTSSPPLLRPLSILTDTWCSSGHFLPDGSLLQTGGDANGLKKIRLFKPCDRPPNRHLFCDDWIELSSPHLEFGRWYATNQILPNGSVIIIGGRAAPSVEFYPPSATYPLRHFPFLTATEDAQLDNLYPFVHLLPDGNLFVFANSRSVLYNPDNGDVIKEYPVLDGGPRNYPSAGSSAMLPLNPGDGYKTVEIVVCGGAPYGVYLHRETDAPAGTTCGRITATDLEPVWSMEEMPFPRVMGDMVMLPTGEVLIINGAQAGSQGFGMASNPALNPLLYRPDQPIGLRFMTLNPTRIPRMYHSTANLLPDGRVLLAGSNPNYFYNFKSEFPTELRLEAFSPEYLAADKSNIRPVIEVGPSTVGYGEEFEVEVTMSLPLVGVVEVNLASAPFVTHSFSQGQRLVRLAVGPAMEVTGNGELYRYQVGCKAPPDPRVAPPGYYMAFAMNLGVPSMAHWVQLVGAR